MGINAVSNFTPSTSQITTNDASAEQAIMKNESIMNSVAASSTTDIEKGKIQSTEEKKIKTSDLVEATDKLNNFMQSLNANLSFKLHVKTNQLMVQVVDIKTNKVLKESPSHEMLDLMAKIREYVGALLDKKA